MWRHEFDEIELPCNIFAQYFSSGYHPTSTVLSIVKTKIIGHHARTLELPLLVRSAVSGEG